MHGLVLAARLELGPQFLKLAAALRERVAYFDGSCELVAVGPLNDASGPVHSTGVSGGIPVLQKAQLHNNIRLNRHYLERKRDDIFQQVNC